MFSKWNSLSALERDVLEQLYALNLDVVFKLHEYPYPTTCLRLADLHNSKHEYDTVITVVFNVEDDNVDTEFMIRSIISHKAMPDWALYSDTIRNAMNLIDSNLCLFIRLTRDQKGSI